MTKELISIKQRFFPRAVPIGTTDMGWMLYEIKGADLRKGACSGSRNIRRHRLGYMDQILQLCERCDMKFSGRIWVKGIGTPINGTSIYTSSIQSIFSDFQNYLTMENDVGFVIADSRMKHQNTIVSHSIFTQKFKSTGDSYDRILELPAFAHSDNHAGLQIADTICSAIMTPIAIHTYCSGYVNSVHVRPLYSGIKTQMAHRCRALQHRYTNQDGRNRGGFIVSDSLGRRPGGLMFR